MLPLKFAVMVAGPSTAMVPAVAVKLAEVAPDGTVTDGGTVRAPALLDSETGTPPAPAAFDRLRVQVEAPPDDRLAGAQPREVISVGATSETKAVWEVPLKLAVTLAVWSLVMVPAAAVKLAEVAPVGTMTDEGTLRAPTLLDRDTAAPPAAAAFDRLTVQVEEPPDARLPGAQLNALTTVVATRETEAVWELPLKLAVTVAV